MKKIFIETNQTITFVEVSAEIIMKFVAAANVIFSHGICPLVASFPWVCGMYDNFNGYKIESVESWHGGNILVCLTK